MKTSEILEVIVFGKGYGESILVRVFDSSFILIDSFLDNNGLPVAQTYLEQNGFTVDDIIGIVCTHWDKDHINGIDQIIQKHRECLPVCSPLILSKKEIFSYLVFLESEEEDNVFLKVLSLCKEGKAKYFAARSNCVLFDNVLYGRSITFKSLTPSDNQINAFIQNLLIPKSGEIKVPYNSFDRNDISLVTLLEHNIDSILLGGDFENTSLYDWKQLSADFSYLRKASVFKIPHHGSTNAFSVETYRDLCNKPISIITRFNNSDLPEEEMMMLIASESSKTFVVGGKKTTDKELTQDIKKYSISGMKQKMMINNKRIGYVRLTKGVGTNWNIEKFGAVEEY